MSSFASGLGFEPSLSGSDLRGGPAELGEARVWFP